EARVKTKIAEVTAARDSVRMQLNGLENQLYILGEFINPTPVPEPLPAAEEAPEEPEPDGVPIEPGKI
ncbi:hypothetical protein LCGC14_3166870, partial [marine sediment metagenome]